MRAKHFQTLKVDGFEWDYVTSSGHETIDSLRKKYHFHPLDLHDIQPPIQRSKVVIRDSYIFMILLYPRYDAKGGEVGISEFDFFISKNSLITVNTDGHPAIKRLFQEAQNKKIKREQLFSGGIVGLFYTVLHELTEPVFPILVTINNAMDSLESRLYDPYEKNLINEILRLKMNVVNMRQAMQGHKMAIRRFMEVGEKHLDMNGHTIYFNDLVQNTKEIWDMLDVEKEQVEAIHETNKTVIDSRTNDVIKTLTIISVVFYPLTLIASMFGMNVVLPIQDQPQSFWMILLLMLTAGMFMLAFFKYKKWI